MTEKEKTPQSFSGSYDAEIKNAYDRLTKREDFKYEPSADPVYSSYRDRYRREGRLAMDDSVAKAADLTGGYGSSYAQSVGRQQYGAYLEKLNDMMPQLYSAAYDRYKAKGDELYTQLSAAGDMADREYSRYADAYERQSRQEQLDYEQRRDAFENLMQLISSTGYMPSAAELEKGGMSTQQAAALSYEFQRLNGLLPEELEGAIAYFDGGPGYFVKPGDANEHRYQQSQSQRV